MYIQQRRQPPQCYFTQNSNSKPTILNSPHLTFPLLPLLPLFPDGYSKVISSVPTKPASYYASATPPSNNRQTDNRPQSPSKDEDDDDYEPMNPAALSVEKWLEVKRTILGGGNDYSIPRPQPRTGTEHNLSPVQYSSLAISPSAATSTASQTQTAPGSRDSASTSSRPFAYTSVAKPGKSHGLC